MAPSAWEKTFGYSKKGFDKAWHALDKLGAPVNRLSNRIGAEAFWPMSLDKESDKAARILRSFCKDGFYEDPSPDEERMKRDSKGRIDRPQGKQRVVKKIPLEVIKQAKGLAIFTTMRTGLWVSGAGGSGVLLARDPETGEWSPPSGIMLHTAGIGFMVGVDIYDCVVVINTYEALEGFKRIRCTLGGEMSVAAGPVGVGGVLETEVHKRQAPIWTYMKSRGVYAGVQVDGTIILERSDENERFYGEKIRVNDILAGKVRYRPDSLKTLMQTIKSAQGDSDVDESVLPTPGQPAPSDMELVEGNFGIPAVDDPDPFGVKALEAEGLFIREAGTKTRPSHDAFEFRPAPSSPIYNTFPRYSMSSSRRTSWRGSLHSYTSVDRGTQTDDRPTTATTTTSRMSSPRSIKESISPPQEDVLEEREEHEEPEYTNGDHEPNSEPEVHEVATTTVAKHESVVSIPPTVDDQTISTEPKRLSPTFTRARLVTIPKRIPPALPPRNPERKHDSLSTTASLPSPTASLRREIGMSHEFSNGETVDHDHHPENADASSEELPPEVEARIDALVAGFTNGQHEENIGTAVTEKDEFHSIASSRRSSKSEPSVAKDELENMQEGKQEAKTEEEEAEPHAVSYYESVSRNDSTKQNSANADVDDEDKTPSETVNGITGDQVHDSKRDTIYLTDDADDTEEITNEASHQAPEPTKTDVHKETP
ncbi:DUF500 domain protein [Paecilomyces variotii No. 5]|uniref:DUF500 domain protein n=1 Tax=Byssochlamys spectabilis (strain No. 5 / NBRC 109023) TaxID=1356009 RepID=V5FTJ8_BYSSN|nr:DUF500 domain protein [Paecilomyces variotii No. 5]